MRRLVNYVASVALPPFERMFIYGGRSDSLVSFVVGQIYIILISIIVSVIALMWISSDQRFWYYSVFAKPATVTVLVMMIWTHEMGHWFMFRIYKIPAFGPMFFAIFGGMMIPGRKLSSWEMINAALAGPLSGIIGAAGLYWGYVQNNSYIMVLAFIWVFINLLNLLPIYPLDGGVIAARLLTYWFSEDVINRWYKRLVYIVLVLGLSIFSLLAFKESLFIPKIIFFQIAIVGMLWFADHSATRVFRWFSTSYLEEVEDSSEPLTKEQLVRGFGIYVLTFTTLLFIAWVALEMVEWELRG